MKPEDIEAAHITISIDEAARRLYENEQRFLSDIGIDPNDAMPVEQFRELIVQFQEWLQQHPRNEKP